MVAGVAPSLRAPLVLFTYYNPILRQVRPGVTGLGFLGFLGFLGLAPANLGLSSLTPLLTYNLILCMRPYACYFFCFELRTWIQTLLQPNGPSQSLE